MARYYSIQENGQVTLPADWREKHGLKKGDVVTFLETDRGLLIQPRQDSIQQALEDIGAALEERGLTLEELIERGRAIRGDLLREHYGLDSDHA